MVTMRSADPNRHVSSITVPSDRPGVAGFNYKARENGTVEVPEAHVHHLRGAGFLPMDEIDEARMRQQSHDERVSSLMAEIAQLEGAERLKALEERAAFLRERAARAQGAPVSQNETADTKTDTAPPDGKAADSTTPPAADGKGAPEGKTGPETKATGAPPAKKS